MPLLNYTTEIPAIKSAMEIEYSLIQHGVKSVLKDFDDDGHIESMSFILPGRYGAMPVRLPVNTAPVLAILERQRRRNSKVKATADQAERVAFRILKDWVEAQMAILETGMVSIEQVFLPYITNAGGQTLYEVMESRQFMLASGMEGDR